VSVELVTPPCSVCTVWRVKRHNHRAKTHESHAGGRLRRTFHSQVAAHIARGR
jgi:hypothetical protein